MNVRVCSIKYAKELNQLNVKCDNIWYHVCGSKKLLLKIDEGLFFDSKEECIIDTSELKKGKSKIIPAYTLGDLSEVLKAAPVNWQYYFNRETNRWLVADFHLTKKVGSDTFEDALAEILVYLLKNDFFDKLVNENHENVELPKLEKNSLKKCTGKAPDNKE